MVEKGLQIIEEYGGPVATRTPDVYRVKVVPVNHLQTTALKIKELRNGDLDLKWTSGRAWTSHGPHTGAAGNGTTLAFARGRSRLFNVVVARRQSILPIRMRLKGTGWVGLRPT